jgi:hypothetical protein
MDTSIWAALQVTSASMMSCESVGTVVRKNLSVGVELVAGVGMASLGHPSKEEENDLHSEAASISNYAVITSNEHMNSFKAVTCTLVEHYSKDKNANKLSFVFSL